MIDDDDHDEIEIDRDRIRRVLPGRICIKIQFEVWWHGCSDCASQAEPLLLEASKIQERSLGNDHPHTVASLSNLATVYEAMGQKERAAAMQSLVKQMKVSWEKKQQKKK